MNKKKGLGRGLEHLITQNKLDKEDMNINDKQIIEILLEDTAINPYQPRKTFDQAALEELAESIKSQGVFQPILVRRTLIGYEIISGERRVRASKIANKTEIPAIVYDYNDEQMMEVALIENIQREDLTIIEEARSYQLLIDNLGLTQKQLATKLGKSRSHITNTISLLKLKDDIVTKIDSGILTMGHAKILVNIKDEQMIDEIVTAIQEDKLSVRQAEQMVKEYKDTNIKTEPKKKQVAKNQDAHKYEDLMREKLETRVKITGNSKGKIEIEYLSKTDLERLIKLIADEE